MRSALVVCVGNICRSPVAERLLRKHLPDVAVASAGLGALIGHPADSKAAEVAATNGVSLDGHVARQFTPAIGEAHDLILVMEPGHRREIGERAPHLRGRTMLFDHWTGAKGIGDPYLRSQDYHAIVFDQIAEAALAWTERLGKKG